MSSNKPHFNLDEADKHFEKYVKDFNKEYKDEEDKRTHYEAFVKNLDKINKLNSNESGTATFGLNKFADYTEDEMKQMRGMGKK